MSATNFSLPPWTADSRSITEAVKTIQQHDF
jgi:hypothetical protein